MSSGEAFYNRLFTCLEDQYPKACREYSPREKLHRLLICPDVIPLPADLADQARSIVKAFSEIRNLPARSQVLSEIEPQVVDPGNFSALMSYDFHVDASGALRLIEINTNASLSLIADCLHDVQGISNPFALDFKKEIISTFEDEARLAGMKNVGQIAIIDERPEAQRLFFEFLLYRELFENAGHPTLIRDSKDLEYRIDGLYAGETKIDLVYNRDTDFYFATPERRALRAAMMTKVACLSPHPHEYRLLADKERLLELSVDGALEALAISEVGKKAIDRALIRTWSLQALGNPDEIWARRKKLFFKPTRSFGGKAAYRGSSVTRSTFAELVNEDYVAQEYVPAPTVKLKSLADQEAFKYDLRFYVYRDRIQLACARAYRGQMTNSQTPGGGVAVIDWV